MRFTLSFQMDNAAFDENPAREVARILFDAAQRIESTDKVPEYFENLRDLNGNTIGTYAAKPDEYFKR